MKTLFLILCFVLLGCTGQAELVRAMPGERGPKGDVGEPGAPGERGPRGFPGAPGSVGETQDVYANAEGLAGETITAHADCPEDAIIVSGGCEWGKSTPVAPFRSVREGNGWTCVGIAPSVPESVGVHAYCGE